MTQPKSFEFVRNVPDQAGYTGAVARVTGNEWGKAELMTLLADQLSFPSYFGHNWDALEESLSDLLPNRGRHVVIVHEVLPRGLTEDELRVYLRVLADAGERRIQACEPPLTAVFPLRERARIEQLLRAPL